MFMRDDRYRPWSWEDDPDLGSVSLINEVPPDNVGVLVPGRQRSLHAIVAQNLADTEALIGRLELGVRVADSGRGLIRELYVQCRRQREVLMAADGYSFVGPSEEGDDPARSDTKPPEGLAGPPPPDGALAGSSVASTEEEAVEGSSPGIASIEKPSGSSGGNSV
jgi:hypothetical protein